MPKGKPKKKSSRQALLKKVVKKKTAKKKAAKKKTKEKNAGLKKKSSPAKKKSTKKAALKAKRSEKMTVPRKVITVEPGPPPSGIPSVEEPAANEDAIGTVTHYYSHLGVAVIQINKSVLNTDDTIHIKGSTTDFRQQVQSMEYEHQHVDQASAGQSVGLKVKDAAREHDIVYRVK